MRDSPRTATWRRHCGTREQGVSRGSERTYLHSRNVRLHQAVRTIAELLVVSGFETKSYRFLSEIVQQDQRCMGARRPWQRCRSALKLSRDQVNVTLKSTEVGFKLVAQLFCAMNVTPADVQSLRRYTYQRSLAPARDLTFCTSTCAG